MLESVRQSNSEAIERRVRTAIDRLSAAGSAISFYAVAKEACVARSTLYRRPELKTLVAEARQKNHSQTQAPSISSEEASSDVEMLQQALAAAEAEINRLLATGANREREGSFFSYAICVL